MDSVSAPLSERKGRQHDPGLPSIEVTSIRLCLERTRPKVYGGSFAPLGEAMPTPGSEPKFTVILEWNRRSEAGRSQKVEIESMTHDSPDLPYEKAIEATAKATGKALDLIGSASPTIADAYAFLIGDRLEAARASNLDEITRKTKKSSRIAMRKTPNRFQSRSRLRFLSMHKENREAKFRIFMLRF